MPARFDFDSVFAPPEHVVLQVRLEPLSLGHLYLLHRYAPPFVVGGVPDPIHLVLGAFLCARPWRESEANLKKWWLASWMKYWGWRTRKLNLDDEAERFAEYLDEALAMPEIRANLSEAPAASRITRESPFFFRIMALLMRRFHLPIAAALDIPVTYAISLITADAEMSGTVRLWDKDTEALWEYARTHPIQEAKN